MSTKTKLQIYTNGEAAFLIWKNEVINGCIGYAIQRSLNGSQSFLMNKYNSKEKKFDETISTPSDKSPFRRFNWEDLMLKSGDEVSYRVIPVDHDYKLLSGSASDWSEKFKITNDINADSELYFNKGIAINQYLKNNIKIVNEMKDTYSKNKSLGLDNKNVKKLHDFLAGQMRVRLLELLTQAKTKNQYVYACLFELNDRDIIEAFKNLKKNCHIILADGAGTKEEPKIDENKDVRNELKKAGVMVTDRLVRVHPGIVGHLGHNKFIIFADGKDNPYSVWTGSTNLTVTGFCTQVNNSILIKKKEVAEIYYKYWEELYKVGDDQPKELKADNSIVKSTGSKNPSYNVWFSPTLKYADLIDARKYLTNAKKGILFLMFEPGPADVGLFHEIQDLYDTKKDLYIKGVKNTLSAGIKPGTEKEKINAIGKDPQKIHNLDIIQPEGIEIDFDGWVKEISRGRFLGQGGVGHAIIHSKIIVVDPFTNPVVIVGSNNFSKSASEKNDENMVIINGDKSLAEAYSVNIINVYNYYRWRFFLKKTQSKLKSYTEQNWQQAKLLGKEYIKEFSFWGL